MFVMVDLCLRLNSHQNHLLVVACPKPLGLLSDKVNGLPLGLKFFMVHGYYHC